MQHFVGDKLKEEPAMKDHFSWKITIGASSVLQNQNFTSCRNLERIIQNENEMITLDGLLYITSGRKQYHVMKN